MVSAADAKLLQRIKDAEREAGASVAPSMHSSRRFEVSQRQNHPQSRQSSESGVNVIGNRSDYPDSEEDSFDH